MSVHRAMQVLLVGVAEVALVQAACREHDLDFILLDGDALSAQIEDDIKSDLSKVGITVNTRLLQKAAFNQAMQDGDFHMCFTESWGPPYDPHAFATGWFRPNNEAHYPALDGVEAPMTKVKLEQMVTAVLKEEDVAERKSKWTDILQEMHNQAISMPMWSRRMPAVMNRRLQGYVAGPQQFDYPMHLITVDSGSTSVVVSPGAQTGLFTNTGPMEAHGYRPNEFFINNWIYEGLVYYGQSGAAEPMLATSWTFTDTSDGGQEYRFTLRQNVKFHDGTTFDCAAVKLNFDHVLQPPLNSLDYHGWYHLPKYTESWMCDGETFVVKLSEIYYPFIQELSFIRPLRILSPSSFSAGASSDPITQNSCPAKWGNPSNPDGGVSNVQCVGQQGLHGTGPWKFVSKTDNSDGTVSEARLAKNTDHWGPSGNVQELVIKNYPDSAAVEAALKAGSLDMVVGGGVLTYAQVKKFQMQEHASFQTILGPPLMNRIVVLNAAKPPTHSLELRKTLMHAINKAAIVDAELAGMATVADSLYPKDAPNCDVDLTPRWDYDFEKARLLNCPAEPTIVTVTQEPIVVTVTQQDEEFDTGLVLGLALGIGIPAILIVAGACFLVGKGTGHKRLSEDKAATPAAVIGGGNDQA